MNCNIDLIFEGKKADVSKLISFIAAADDEVYGEIRDLLELSADYEQLADDAMTRAAYCGEEIYCGDFMSDDKYFAGLCQIAPAVNVLCRIINDEGYGFANKSPAGMTDFETLCVCFCCGAEIPDGEEVMDEDGTAYCAECAAEKACEEEQDSEETNWDDEDNWDDEKNWDDEDNWDDEEDWDDEEGE